MSAQIQPSALRKTLTSIHTHNFLLKVVLIYPKNPEREGFEPSAGFPAQTFEIRTLNHSDTSPADKNILAQSKLKYNLVQKFFQFV